MKQAASIVLIVDLWSNESNAQFLALGAAIMNSNLEREVIVIGMVPMDVDSTAENIKLAIQKILNEFDFDKETIHGKS